MNNRNINEKGFTLIELLAVIIILGVLMLMAIPAVTEYIADSRKKTYINSAKQYINGVMIKVNSLEYIFTDPDIIYYVPSKCVKLEKGGKSPFGEWLEAYVAVTFDGEGYNYYWTSFDSAGYGVDLTKENELVSNKVTTNKRFIDKTIPKDGTSKMAVMDEDICDSNVAASPFIYDDKVKDISGNGNDGTLVGATYNSAGEFLHFDGVDDFLNAGLVGYDFGTNVTYVIRMKLNILSGPRCLISNTDSSGFAIDQNVLGGIESNKITLWAAPAEFPGSYISIQNPTELNQGQWYTLVGTYDGAFLKLYISGVLVNQRAMTDHVVPSVNTPIIIGAEPAGQNVSLYSNFSDMDLKEVLVFNRALSDSEISINYANIIKVTNRNSLLFHYKF